MLTSFQRQDEPARRDPGKAAKELLKRMEEDQRAPSVAWTDALNAAKYTEQDLAIVMTVLHRRKKYDMAVEGLQAAIRHGLVAPWMYEALAIEMKLAGRPQRQIDRVVTSRIDFAAGDDDQMLVTASTLAGFDAYDEAIGICKELAKRAPYNAKLWSTARRIADLSGNLQHRVWSRVQTTKYVWDDDAARLHETMVQELKDLRNQAARSQNNSSAASSVDEAILKARHRDLRVLIEWAGDGDLDLEIVEPDGTVCRRRNPVTKNHGVLVKQNSVENSKARRQFEEYVCIDALEGNYTVRAKYIDGRIVLGRVVVRIIRNSGTPGQTVETASLKGVVDGEPTLQFRFPKEQ